MNDAKISQEHLVKQLQEAFLESGKTLALAESCTGGAIAAALTAIPGASKFFLGSVVAYSNEWKESFLGCSSQTLQTKGAVSLEVVAEMVDGLFARTDADFCVAVSGVLGPSGGSAARPVGTVFVAIGKRGDNLDAGLIHAPQDRKCAIDFLVITILAALLSRLVHNKKTFTS
jgi:PncC family amidohydrolase